MAEVLLLTGAQGASAAVLPALEFVPHRVRVKSLHPGMLVDLPETDVILLDARRDLAAAKGTARLLNTMGLESPVIVVVTEGTLTALNAEWGATDFVLDSASPAELEARIRMALAGPEGQEESEIPIAQGGLTIDQAAYSARLHGNTLDLTYKEFELLRYLAAHPGRVFTRTQLLREVWGFDYYGGSRTVDVHVRRLRAKLGAENENLIGTVRNVGYRFDAPKDHADTPDDADQPNPDDPTPTPPTGPDATGEVPLDEVALARARRASVSR